MVNEQTISRRRFVGQAAGGLAAANSLTSARGGATQPENSYASREPLRVRNFDEFLAKLDPQARSENCTDGLICGDLQTEVRAVGSTWMASMAVLQSAVAKGINLIVTHEPTFWCTGTTKAPELKRCEESQVDLSFKVQFIAEHGIAIIRAHDCWDAYPKYGIEDSLRAALELPEPSRTIFYLRRSVPFHLYQIPKTTLEGLARHCKGKLGLTSVRVSGDLGKPVERIVMAYGASSTLPSYYRFWKEGIDAVISGEQTEWQVVRPAIDMGLGIVELGHSNTEAFGMEGMARLLREHFPGVRIEYLPTGDSFKYV
jgi:putative NIF3 family GTP cyclohydrolase 1 type 2